MPNRSAQLAASFIVSPLRSCMHAYMPLSYVKDGTASIERVLAFVSGGIDRAAGTRRVTRGDFDDQESDDDDDGMDNDALGDARWKLRSALKLGTAKEMSPRRLFEYLDPDGLGEVRATSGSYE